MFASPAAAASAFTLRSSPCSSQPIDATTGRKPASPRASIARGSPSTTSPTRPGSKSSPVATRHRARPPSHKVSPIAGTPSATRLATRSVLTRPASTPATISICSGGVMRMPSRRSVVMPSLFTSRSTSPPPPWTTTTRSPARCSRARRWATVRRIEDSSRAAPPILTTTARSAEEVSSVTGSCMAPPEWSRAPGRTEVRSTAPPARRRP